ncbi:MAG: tetratricopeptide repeat protein [Isosphaeraceae bacterium]
MLIRPEIECPARRPRLRRRRALAAACLAGLSIVGGCVHGPRQVGEPTTAASASESPQTSGEPTPTVSVDLNRTVGENTTFHRSATDRQRFQVHVDFGKVFETQGNLEGATQEYREAIKIAEARRRRGLNHADAALAHRRLASALDRQGRFRESEPHYRTAQHLAAKDPRVWNDSGYSYYLQGRWEEAETALRTAQKLAPDDARIRTNLGMVLAAAGKTRDALPLLSNNQGDAIGHANLGYLLAATGQYDHARREYQEALLLRPDLALAQRALNQLDRQQNAAATGTTAIATNAPSSTATRVPMPVDPAVTRASATSAAPTEVLPPLPPPPNLSLPSDRP